MMKYVNCPKCSTYQPFGKGKCQICGADLEPPSDEQFPQYKKPPEPSVPIVSIDAPTGYTPPPTMSIEDYIAQHKQEVAEQQDQEDEPVEDEEGGLPVYALVGQDVIDQIINYDWFESECFPANPMNQDQDWARNHYFVPIKRLDDLFGDQPF